MPGYEASFRMLSVHVKPDRPLTGDAAADAAAILSGLRAGHVYTAVDGFATSPSFRVQRHEPRRAARSRATSSPRTGRSRSA